MQISPSCSSFELLDPHDPVISRLATQLFQATNDYLQGEMSAGQVSTVVGSRIEDIFCKQRLVHEDLKQKQVPYRQTLKRWVVLWLA